MEGGIVGFVMPFYFRPKAKVVPVSLTRARKQANSPIAFNNLKTYDVEGLFCSSVVAGVNLALDNRFPPEKRK